MSEATPKRFPDRDAIARVREDAAELEPGDEGAEERRLAGRVMARRDMGKLVFLDLVDLSGRIQLLCPEARTGEIDVHLGDVVGAVGKAIMGRKKGEVVEVTAPRGALKFKIVEIKAA